MREEPARGGVRSVGKAMELLEVLLARRRPMSLGELTEAMGYPKSTLDALLATLRAYSAIEQREDGRYYLGVRLFECGCAVSEAWDITRAARPHLEQLAERTCASAFLSLLEGGTVISLDQCAASTGTGLQVVVEIGTRLPLHATAQGKLLLSRLSDSEALSRLSAAGMPAFTPHTITEPQRLMAALADIRRAGCAVEDGEYKIGLRAAAAPVLDRGGQLRYALGVVGLFRRVASEEFQRAMAETIRQARQLSAALGCPPDAAFLHGPGGL